jgi:hypothetical protein
MVSTLIKNASVIKHFFLFLINYTLNEFHKANKQVLSGNQLAVSEKFMTHVALNSINMLAWSLAIDSPINFSASL